MSKRQPVIERNRSRTAHARTKGKPTPIYSSHLPGRSPMVGNVERLEDKIRMAHELKARGYYNYEIADAIAEHFGCDRPDVTTVSNWLAAHRATATEDIKGFINEARLNHFKILQELIRKWHEIASRDRFALNRFPKTNGELQPLVDENAFDEQAKAVVITVKLLERQAKLLGLDLPSPKTDAELQALSMARWYEKFSREVVITPEGVQCPGGEMLEFRAGDPVWLRRLQQLGYCIGMWSVPLSSGLREFVTKRSRFLGSGLWP